ncbi:MAG: transposase, partial [Bacteroidales bacterium]|nr:transposase [Bacteroidales bacterium]
KMIVNQVRLKSAFETNSLLCFQHFKNFIFVLSEIGDIHRFDIPNKLVAFAGLDVKVTQSGEFVGTKNRISKRGSPYLRRAIWLAAGIAAFNDPILSEYYQSLRARGKHHLTAVGAVSRKLCNIIFVILRENRPYEALPPKR